MALCQHTAVLSVVTQEIHVLVYECLYNSTTGGSATWAKIYIRVSFVYLLQTNSLCLLKLNDANGDTLYPI